MVYLLLHPPVGEDSPCVYVGAGDISAMYREGRETTIVLKNGKEFEVNEKPLDIVDLLDKAIKEHSKGTVVLSSKSSDD